MKHEILVLTLLAAGCAPAVRAEPAAKPATPAGARPAPAAPGAIQLDPDAVVFRPGPPSLPKGVELAVLEGDPQKPGIFTLRLKAPPGFVLPPHTHPVDERVTVLTGSIAVGFGDKVERAAARAFGPGAFYVNPAGVAHYVFSELGAVVQITGLGPWKVEPISKPTR